MLEPLQHGVVVVLHPPDVALGLLDALGEGAAAAAELTREVALELKQLERIEVSLECAVESVETRKCRFMSDISIHKSKRYCPQFLGCRTAMIVSGYASQYCL